MASYPGTTGPIEPSVFVWPASYYLLTSHHWVHGELQLTHSTLCFYNHATTADLVTTPEKQAKNLLQMIKLDNIAEIKKLLSSYLFKCLVILTKDGMHHWFGSLPGRDGVYNTLIHFWRERLLVGPARDDVIQERSQLGEELISLTQQSSTTLKEAGQTLHHQGEQLNYAQSIMHDLHSDLDVAECLTTNLESWFGHWGMSERNLPLEPIEMINANGIPIIHEFSVLFHTGKQTQAKVHEHGLLNRLHLSPRRGPMIGEENGHLRVSKEGMTVLNSDQIPQQHFKTRDISTINVTSPWKMTIIKYCLGEPDIVYKITSAQMVNILPVLHSIVPDKLQYESPMGPPVGDPVWPHLEKQKPTSIIDNQQQCTSIVERLTANVSENLDILKGSENISRNLRNCSPKRSGSVGRGGENQTQALKSKNATKEEVTKLSDLIGEMKSMALHINGEQERQMDAVDRLSESVDKANDRLKAENKRITRLL